MEAADSPLTECVQCEAPFKSNVLVCVDCYRTEIEGFDKQIKNLSIEKEFQQSYQKFVEDLQKSGGKEKNLIKTAARDEEEINLFEYEKMKKQLEDEIQSIKTKNKLLITQLSQLQIKNSQFDQEIHSKSIQITLQQLQNAQMKLNIKDKTHLINELTSVNILNSIYEISFQNTTSLLNSKPINFTNCQPIAQIFKFFLSKHQKYSSSILVDLSQMAIYLTESHQKYETLGKEGIPINCSNLHNTVNWLNIILQQMKTFGQYIQCAYFPQQSFPFKIETTSQFPTINSMFLIQKEKQNLQAFKYLMYDLKYLINLQFYISEM